MTAGDISLFTKEPMMIPIRLSARFALAIILTSLIGFSALPSQAGCLPTRIAPAPRWFSVKASGNTVSRSAGNDGRGSVAFVIKEHDLSTHQSAWNNDKDSPDVGGPSNMPGTGMPADGFFPVQPIETEEDATPHRPKQRISDKIDVPLWRRFGPSRPAEDQPFSIKRWFSLTG